MALFGKAFDKAFSGFPDPLEEERRRQLLAAQQGGSGGLVESPQQAEQRRALEQHFFGNGPVPTVSDGPMPASQQLIDQTPMSKQLAKAGMIGRGGVPRNFVSQNASRLSDTGNDTPGMHGATARNQRAPWELSGREKFGQLLGNIGTALMTAQAARDGNWSAVASLNQNMQTQALAARRRAQLGSAMRNMGYDDASITLALSDPESIGKNYNTRLQSRVVAPGSSVVEGGPGGPRAAYTQPNQYQQYATAQGYQPGTPEYRRAQEAYVLRGNSETAMGYDQQLDDHRSGNARELESLRQSGREKLKGMPSYRDTHAPPPTYRDLHPPVPRASGGGGGGGGIVDVQTPAEAAKLPRGSRFRTPDGMIRRVP